MPKQKRLSKSQRKFISKEKGRIRRTSLDMKKQREEIEKLKERFLSKNK